MNALPQILKQVLDLRVSRRAATAALAAVLAAPLCVAQSMPLIYGLNETGKITINGTVLDSLPSSFDPDAPNQNTLQRWNALAVVGPDRYALRLDGALYKNGKSLYKLLTFVINGTIPTWDSLSVSDGNVYALREDGLLSTNGVSTVTLPAGGFGFLTVLGEGGFVYSLRTDGSVYRNIETTQPVLKFVGGPGIDLDLDGPVGPDTASTTALDGAGSETLWVTLAFDPVSGNLYGLRRDGKIAFGSAITGIVSPNVAVLPFPSDPDDVDQNDDRYRKLTFTSDGAWQALRGDGRIYTPASVLVPLVDLPSDGSNAIDDTYLDQAVDGTDFWTIRWDGNVYHGTDADSALNLTSTNYRNIELSFVAPDLTNVKNPKPLAMTYSVKVLEGQAFTIPVDTSDLELTEADLSIMLLDPLKKPLPPGLVFTDFPASDPFMPPTISWDNPTPKGSYTVPVVVSDGENKPKTYKYKVKVILPDTNPLKNKKPFFWKVKNLQALVDFEYALQIFAADADPEDAGTVTLTVDTTKEPFFSQGATFDATPGSATGLFSWTPTFDNIGKTKVKFFATDQLGASTSYSVTIKVVNSLIFPSLP